MMFYIVTAYRWGDNDVLQRQDNEETNRVYKHSYVVGLFDDVELAIKVALEEKDRRGGKYECQIVKCIGMNSGVFTKHYNTSNFEI